MAGTERAKLIPRAAAAALWGASSVLDFGPARWASAGIDRLLGGAAICVTVWALLAAYDVRGRVNDQGRRLDAYGDGWALLHEDAEAARRRARMHPVRGRAR